MGSKGEETRQMILQKAYGLFAERGFQAVTMQDICMETGLSRGGLYRHFGSTDEIFAQIVTSFLQEQNSRFQAKIAAHIPAGKILEETLNRYRDEMLDADASLSLAIYEYFGRKSVPPAENPLRRQYEASCASWEQLLTYGISRGELKKVDVRSFFDLLVFSYQGVRMYSRLMPIEPAVPERITGLLKNLLLEREEK